MGVYSQIAANKMKSYLLFFSFIVFIGLLGILFGEVLGFGFWLVPASLVFAIILSFASYYFSDRIVLAISKARPADEREHAYLKNSVEGLALAAGIPAPRVYVIDDTATNAFATGRDPKHAVICVTTGLMQKLNRLELEGVLAHEMSHIKNFDVRFMMLVTVMAAAVVLLSDLLLRMFLWGGAGSDRRGGGIAVVFILLGLALAILSPIIAQLIKFAISRRREFLADAGGALLTRYPEGLASALEKIGKDKEPLEAANKATAHLYISNPLKGQKIWFASLFSTHPRVEERVKALRAM